MRPSIPLRFLFHPVHLLSLGLGTGLLPKAPGTMGTLLGVLIYLSLQPGSWLLYTGVVVLFFLLGIGACQFTAARLQVHDHPAIVWDEVVGYLVAMLFAPQGWAWIGLGFVLFRLFDIFKPWPIGWVDRRVGGGIGIMLDDLLAAIYAMVLIQVMVYLI